MIKKLLLLVSLFGLTTCGINVSGSVDVNVHIDMLQKYFEEYCAEKFPYSEDLQKACVDEEMKKFLDIMLGNQ